MRIRHRHWLLDLVFYHGVHVLAEEELGWLLDGSFLHDSTGGFRNVAMIRMFVSARANVRIWLIIRGASQRRTTPAYAPMRIACANPHMSVSGNMRCVLCFSIDVLAVRVTDVGRHRADVGNGRELLN